MANIIKVEHLISGAAERLRFAVVRAFNEGRTVYVGKSAPLGDGPDFDTHKIESITEDGATLLTAVYHVDGSTSDSTVSLSEVVFASIYGIGANGYVSFSIPSIGE